MKNRNKIIATKIMGLPDSWLCSYADYTNPIHDYMVLQKVRDTWSDGDIQLFIGCLFQFYSDRTKDPALLFLQYCSGDYSNAALRVLEFTNKL